MDNKVLKISNRVQWIGVLDKEITTFDVVMETEFGTTYNSYFINGEKKAIVETVKEKFWDVYEAKLRKVVNPEDIDYIIVNHTEPDHSGSIKRLLAIAPKAIVVGSSSALRFLKDQVGGDFPSLMVKENDVIDLINCKLTVISAPNLHWPDSIYTFLEDDNILFSCDSFGAHFCHDDMFDNLVPHYDDAFKYYFDVILKPFSRFFLKAIEKIKLLDIKTICPGHGPILSTTYSEIIAKTEALCHDYLNNYPVKNRILVAYVSAYGYTKMIAEKIVEGIGKVDGVEVDFCDIEKMPIDLLADKIAKASAYLLGSPTINQNMLPQLYSLFSLMTPLRDKDKLAACFGSYGWSGEAERDLISNIENLKLNYTGDSLFLKFKPQEVDYERIVKFGERFALLVKGQ